ncbi:cation_ATPase_N domain-containing protein, partial [Haematococcus lacustris]
SSIVAAVEEGRVIFDNLRKTIAYTLTHALPELFPIFLNLALSFPLGLGGLLILSIDLVTEQGPAISLAYEPAEANVMLRPPRDVATERLIDGRLLRYSYLIAGVLQSAVCMIAFFSVFWWYGISVPQVAFGIDRGNFLVPDGSSSNLDTTR